MKRADSVDVEVGRRIGSRRRALRMSQRELANTIGVSFQQVQNYEKGTSRIGASRLQSICDALDLPVSLALADTSSALVSSGFALGDIYRLLEPGQGSPKLIPVRLFKALKRIKNRRQRQLLVHVAEQLAYEQE